MARSYCPARSPVVGRSSPHRRWAPILPISGRPLSPPNAALAYKQGIVDGHAADIVYSDVFTGIHGNYLRASIIAAGLNPDHLPPSEPGAMNFGGSTAAKAWRDIWGSGQGIGAVTAIKPAAAYIACLAEQYREAKAELAAKTKP